ncbi:uncharacterized protein LOC114312442 [Camellia sinensis]|uniref:uncharacterized protein LOC114312442 n=1 Tax=Camellia sinensis TaxID=4442 RepID=UPI001035AB78|nr:uncharacterized protein LOC114312442 [Camellia sinensis]
MNLLRPPISLSVSIILSLLFALSVLDLGFPPSLSCFLRDSTVRLRLLKEDRPVELHEREVTRLRSEKGSRLWIGIETGIETVTSRVEARGGDEIMNTGLLVILLRSGPPVATAPQ